MLFIYVPRSWFAFGLTLDNERLIVLAGRLRHLEEQLIGRWLFNYPGRRVNCKRRTQH